MKKMKKFKTEKSITFPISQLNQFGMNPDEWLLEGFIRPYKAILTKIDDPAFTLTAEFRKDRLENVRIMTL